MSVVTDIVIPDSIVPVDEWRGWNWVGGKLQSVTNNTTWEPNKALKAKCLAIGHSRQQRLTLRKGYGMTLEEAQNASAGRRSFAVMYTHMVPTPLVEPPPGYGYVWEEVPHDPPHEGCSCGIYAVKTRAQVPGGIIYGKVKLWGKVVPGTKGIRAEYAYPSELHVPSHLVNDPGILAYGVPVVEREPLSAGKTTVPFLFPLTLQRKKEKRALHFAIAANVAACLLNLGLIVHTNFF